MQLKQTELCSPVTSLELSQVQGDWKGVFFTHSSKRDSWSCSFVTSGETETGLSGKLDFHLNSRVQHSFKYVT